MATFPDNVDFTTFFSDDGSSDLDPNWGLISGGRAVIEQVVRHWIANQGDYDDNEVGCSLYKFFNASLSDVQRLRIQTDMELQAQMVEGVDAVSIAASYNSQGQMFCQCQITLADQTSWDLVFSLTDASEVQLNSILQNG